jgi:PKHD-type hydroxylase
MSNIIVIKEFLSKLECSNVLDNSLKTLELIDASVYGGRKPETKIDAETRKSKISFTSDMGFVNDRLKEILKEKVKINGFDTTNLYLFQFTEYEKGGHFDWHVDSTKDNFSDRYYSCIILLNEDYSGGELEIKENYETITIQKNTGDLILFPATYLHRVSPVLEGKRYTLVNWVMVDTNKPKTKSLI